MAGLSAGMGAGPGLPLWQRSRQPGPAAAVWSSINGKRVSSCRRVLSPAESRSGHCGSRACWSQRRPALTGGRVPTHLGRGDEPRSYQPDEGWHWQTEAPPAESLDRGKHPHPACGGGVAAHETPSDPPQRPAEQHVGRQQEAKDRVRHVGIRPAVAHFTDEWKFREPPPKGQEHQRPQGPATPADGDQARQEARPPPSPCARPGTARVCSGGHRGHPIGPRARSRGGQRSGSERGSTPALPVYSTSSMLSRKPSVRGGVALAAGRCLRFLGRPWTVKLPPTGPYRVAAGELQAPDVVRACFCFERKGTLWISVGREF